jgi:hypothetical protein
MANRAQAQYNSCLGARITCFRLGGIHGNAINSVALPASFCRSSVRPRRELPLYGYGIEHALVGCGRAPPRYVGGRYNICGPFIADGEFAVARENTAVHCRWRISLVFGR